MQKQINLQVASKPYPKILFWGMLVMFSVFFIGWEGERTTSAEKEADIKQASREFLEKTGLEKATLIILLVALWHGFHYHAHSQRRQ